MGRWKLFKCFMRNASQLSGLLNQSISSLGCLCRRKIFSLKIAELPAFLPPSSASAHMNCFAVASLSFRHSPWESFHFSSFLRQQFFMQDQIVHNRICVRRYKLAAEAAAAEIMPSATMWIMISLRTKKWNKTAKLFPANKAISLRSANAEDVSCRTGE